jgi:dolichol-phosphate mannosyltransferase
MNRPLFSIVSPVYKAEKIVPELVRRIECSVKSITEDFEIVLVCDGSPDNSWIAIKEECAKDKRVVGVNLSRNFGQHYAITAGMRYARGEWVVLMDCDLQDRPEEIPRLYEKALEGYDIVQCRRTHRKDGFFKRLSSKAFHVVFDWFSGMNTDSTISNLGIYSRKVIDAFNEMQETSRSFGTLLSYVGFHKCTIDVEHSERFEGRSSYSLRSLMKLMFDITISNSNKPLRVITLFGFVFSFISFLLALYNLMAHWLGIVNVQGFTTTVFSIWFIGGVNMMVLGVVGLYIGKIFNQVKQRPLYIVAEEINVEINKEEI